MNREGVFIVISVVFGFAVSQFGEYRANRELVARVLAGIEAEMEQNLANLEHLPRISAAALAAR